MPLGASVFLVVESLLVSRPISGKFIKKNHSKNSLTFFYLVSFGLILLVSRDEARLVSFIKKANMHVTSG
jgi:hypothetical protein